MGWPGIRREWAMLILNSVHGGMFSGNSEGCQMGAGGGEDGGVGGGAEVGNF